MTYVNKLVGLTGTTPEPVSGALLVNNLSEISTNFAANIKRREDASMSTAWSRILLNAEQKLDFRIYNELMKEEKFRQSIVHTHDYFAGSATRTASARWEGARIKTAKQDYCKLFVQGVYVVGSGSFVVKIFDLQTGAAVHTLPAVTITGEGMIPVEKSINLSKLNNDYLIAVDCTSIDLTAIDGNKGFFFDSCNPNSRFLIETTSGYIFESQEKKATNFTSSQCFVHVVAEIQTDINDFLTRNYNLTGLNLAAQALCGHLLIEESFTSDAFNISTNTNLVQRQDSSEKLKYDYKNYVEKLVQPIMMRLYPTQVLEDKHASEKSPGIRREDALFGVYDLEYENRYGRLNNLDYPI